MSQAQDKDFALDPYNLSGISMTEALNRMHATLRTSSSGSTRPSWAQAGTLWLDNGSTPPVLKLFDGTADFPITRAAPVTLSQTFNQAAAYFPGETVTGPDGLVYQAKAPILPGAWDATLWNNISSNVLNQLMTEARSGPNKTPFALRNKLINGGFRFAQRGSSLPAAAGSRFLADRWITASSGTTLAPSTQTFPSGQTDVPGEPINFHRVVVASVAGDANFGMLTQFIEGVRTLAGQDAVLSFRAKADAPKDMSMEFNQVFGTGGSPSANVNLFIGKVHLTDKWQPFTIPVTVPSISGKNLGTNGDDKLNFNFWFDGGASFNARNGNLGQQSGTFDIANVQLERGSIATPFEDRPFGMELALCQRYFCKSYNLWDAPGTVTNSGCIFNSMVTGLGSYGKLGEAIFPVEMRRPPIVTLYSPATGAVGKIQATGMGDVNGDVPAGAIGCRNAPVRLNNVTVGGGGADCWVQWTAQSEL